MIVAVDLAAALVLQSAAGRFYIGLNKRSRHFGSAKVAPFKVDDKISAKSFRGFNACNAPMFPAMCVKLEQV